MSGIDFVWPEQEEFCYSSDTEVKEFNGKRLKANPLSRGLWVRDPIPPRTQAYPSPLPSVLAKQVAPPEQLYRAEDFDYSEILIGTYQEAEQAFLERHPEFDRDSVKHFIFKL